MSSPIGYPQGNAYPMFSSTSVGDNPVAVGKEVFPLYYTPSTTGGITTAGTVTLVSIPIVDPTKGDILKGVAINAGWMYVRTPWDATYDRVQMVRLVGTDPTANNPVDFYGVRLIPVATAANSTAVAAAFAAATGAQVIAVQSDSVAPLNYNSTFIGANHGAFICHLVTMAGHGKTAADIGSEWSGPSSRKFYIAKIVSSSQLWLVSDNSGTHDRWAFYLTLLNGQTLTHSSGATNTADLVLTADTLTQFTPALSRRSLSVQLDGAAVSPSAVTYYSSVKSLRINDGYGIVNPADAVAYIKARAGQSPSFFADEIGIDVYQAVQYDWNSNGCVRVAQNTTWFSAVNLAYQYGAQDIPPTILSGGALSQYVPGVTTIGGLDYRAKVDITSSLTPFSTPAATWLDAQNPPNRMAQIVSVSGVDKYGTVLGYSPINGITTRTKRLVSTDDAGGVASAGNKKQYPRAATGPAHQPAIGESWTVVAYHHVFNSAWVPDATVATWFRDGSDYVVVLDFHKTSTLSRVALPPVCDGWSARLVDSQAVRLLTTTIIDGGGLAVTCDASYGYAVIRVSAL